jgi:ATP-binding cassette subfamily B protein
MLEIIDAVPAISDGDVSDRGRQAPLNGRIEFRNLTMRFPGSELPVLHDVSFVIEAGETAAFVGSTGSGKSTLVSLLPRLHDAPQGTVFLDGIDVREIPLSRLRASIGVVPQEPFLFSDSIRENIAFGVEHPGASLQQGVEAAAAIARLDKDVEGFPRGYDTLVGERGITLSGGQKQRTAIARALMTDPRILILDDALSAVDTYTEEEILQRLRGLMRQRTSVIVAHRISTVRDADRIFVLDGGRIVERGTHEELVTRGGLYAGMYRKQLLEEELAAS